MFAPKPSPVPLETQLHSENQIRQHRRLHCPHYNGCLDESVRRGWESFSCLSCPVARMLDEHQAHEGDLKRAANWRRVGPYDG